MYCNDLTYDYGTKLFWKVNVKALFYHLQEKYALVQDVSLQVSSSVT